MSAAANNSARPGRAPAQARFGRQVRDLGLLLAAAAITARALFPSEDADSGSGLSLLPLELACGVCWAFDRWLNRRSAPIGLSARPLCFLLGWLWLSTLAASYRFGAIIMAWEWTGVAFVCLFLAQASDASIRRSIAALVMGLVIGQSLLAWWQVGVTFPELRRMYQRQDPALVKAMQDELGVAPDSPEAISLQSRLLHSTEPYGTFGLPNSLAGFLVLGLPAVAAAAWKRTAGGPARIVAAAALVLVASALALTKSRSAWLAVLAIGIGSAWWLGRAIVRRHWRILAGTLAFLAFLVAVLAGVGLMDRLVLTEATKSLSYRGEWWQASLGILADRPIVGVGLGNFGDHYLQHKLPFSSEEIRDPHNFLLELWCTAGLPALVAYLAALAGALRMSWQTVSTAETTPRPGAAARNAAESCLPRSYQVGAGAGLALAALVKLGLGEAMMQAASGDLPAIFAFGAWPELVTFALGLVLGAMLSGMLADRSLAAVLALGAAALHVNWLAAGSPSYPALLLPCWAALAICSDGPSEPIGSTWLNGLLSLLTAAVFGCFLWTLLLPILGREQIHRQLRSIKEPMSDRLVAGYRAAAECVPGDQDGWVRLAVLHAARMRAVAEADSRRPGGSRKEARRGGGPPVDARAEYAGAVAAFRRALELAPHRSSTYQLLGRLHAQAAEGGLDPAARQRASAAFARMVELYPHSAARRFELASALLADGLMGRAAEEFRQALWLDQTPHLDKRLTPAQRTLAVLYGK